MQNYNNFFQLKVLYSNNNFNWVLFDYRLCTILILITKLHSILEGRIIEVNLATPKVVGFKKTPVDVDSPGVDPADSSGSSKALMEAELRLAQAQMEVLRLRSQVKLFKWSLSDCTIVEISYFLTTITITLWSFHLSWLILVINSFLFNKYYIISSVFLLRLMYVC